MKTRGLALLAAGRPGPDAKTVTVEFSESLASSGHAAHAQAGTHVGPQQPDGAAFVYGGSRIRVAAAALAATGRPLPPGG